MRLQTIAPLLLATTLTFVTPALSAPRDAPSKTSLSGARPAHVPASYVPTPFGYMAPECITELKSHETLRDGRIVSKQDGTSRVLAPCKAPRYDPKGMTQKPARSDTIPMTLPIAVGGVQLWAMYGGFGASVTTVDVPNPPRTQTGQTIYLFASVSNGPLALSEGGLTVLGWNMFGTGGAKWQVTTMHFDAGGQLVYAAPAQVVGPVSMWILNRADDAFSGSISGNGPYTLGVGSSGGRTNQVDGVYTLNRTDNSMSIGMAAYGVDSCDQLPAGGATGSVMVMNNSGEPATQYVRTYMYSTACNTALNFAPAESGGTRNFTLTYSDAPPRPAGRSAKITYIDQ